jgi:hypothetical protein
VASYFFSRGGGDAGKATKFVSTIARQLAHKSPQFKELLRETVSKDEDIVCRVLRDQWRELIITPLKKLELRSPIIIVVDALDECDSNSSIKQVLQLLADTQNLDRQLLRIFITSRPESLIRHEFSQFLPDEQHLILQDISKFIVDKDISLFLKNELVRISPEEEVVAQLVRKAAGLFIWAATACRFILEGASPERRLHIILGSSVYTSTPTSHINGVYVALVQDTIRNQIWNAGYFWFWMAIACGFVRQGIIFKQLLRTLVTGNTTPEGHLDVIYLTVLDSSIRPSFTPQDVTDFHNKIKYLLGSIVVLFSSLSVKSLSNLLSKAEKEIIWTMQDLHALLDIPGGVDRVIRLHHPSFRDFLLNRRRCCDSYFWVDEKQAHVALADNCIQLMSKLLKQDICGLGAPGTLVADVPEDKLEQHLPPELRYACLYWVQHIDQIRHHIKYGDSTDVFLRKHFLHWLEAMSLVGETNKCTHMIEKLRALANVGVIHYVLTILLY